MPRGELKIFAEEIALRERAARRYTAALEGRVRRVPKVIEKSGLRRRIAFRRNERRWGQFTRLSNSPEKPMPSVGL